jgi:paraquat-inducible protein A
LRQGLHQQANPEGEVAIMAGHRPAEKMDHSIRARLCPQCDLLVQPPDLGPDQLSRCPRCGVELDRGSYASRESALAMAAAAGQLWILMNVFPLVALTLGGQRQQTTLSGAAVALATHGMPELALLVAVTAIVAPGVEIGLALYLLGRLETLARSGALGRGVRWFRAARRWNMVDVFMLGCLVSIVKLANLADLVVGPALWACAVLLPALAFLNVTMRPERLFGHFGDV